MIKIQIFYFSFLLFTETVTFGTNISAETHQKTAVSKNQASDLGFSEPLEQRFGSTSCSLLSE